MNCKEAKSLIALLAGNDLDPAAAHEVRRHLDACTPCRQKLQQLRSCLEALQAPTQDAWASEGESLWPQLSIRLAAAPPERAPHRLNGWAPALVVAAACTVMFWVAARPSTNEMSRFDSPMLVQPVNAEPNMAPLPELERFAPRPFDEPSDMIPLRRTAEGFMLTPVNNR